MLSSLLRKKFVHGTAVKPSNISNNLMRSAAVLRHSSRDHRPSCRSLLSRGTIFAIPGTLERNSAKLSTHCMALRYIADVDLEIVETLCNDDWLLRAFWRQSS